MAHNPDHVAHIAATLLTGKFDAEPHHIAAAVSAALTLLDTVTPPEPAEPAEPAEAGEGSEAGEGAAQDDPPAPPAKPAA